MRETEKQRERESTLRSSNSCGISINATVETFGNSSSGAAKYDREWKRYKTLYSKKK